MKSLIAASLLTLFSPLLFANQDITCWDGDCLKNGWTQKDMATGAYTDNQCYRDGCEKSGWIMGGTMGTNDFTMCKEDSCFTKGWFVAPRGQPIPYMEVVCEAQNGAQSDCLKFGWTSYHREGGLDSYSCCTDRNCKQKGWVTVLHGGHVQLITCKNGDCFHIGWMIQEQ